MCGAQTSCSQVIITWVCPHVSHHMHLFYPLLTEEYKQPKLLFTTSHVLIQKLRDKGFGCLSVSFTWMHRVGRCLGDNMWTLTPHHLMLMWNKQAVNHRAGCRLIPVLTHWTAASFVSRAIPRFSISITSGHWKALLCKERTLMRVKKLRVRSSSENTSSSNWQTFINLLLFLCQR